MAAPEKPDPSIVTAPNIDEQWTVEKALATIPTGRPTEGSPTPMPFFHLLERLKTTKREGWRRFGINHGESIADHSFRMALMAMLLPTSLARRVDVGKCIKMCLVHDMGETLVGDLTPADNVPRTEKRRRERDTMDYITERLLGIVLGGVEDGGEHIGVIWQEQEDLVTLESKCVQDIDKVELLLQMVEYEMRAGGKINLVEFTYVANKVLLPEMQAWVEEILGERKEFWEGKNLVHSEAEVENNMRKMQDNYYGS